MDIAGVPIDVLKGLGFSDADLEYIRDASGSYWDKYSRDASGWVWRQEIREAVVAIAINSSRVGLALGIAHTKNLTDAKTLFGP